MKTTDASICEPYMGIGKYQPMHKMTTAQRRYWNQLPDDTRLAIRNGDAPGMRRRQLIERNF